MGRSFDFLLAAAALIVGILLLTGHGDFFTQRWKYRTPQSEIR